MSHLFYVSLVSVVAGTAGTAIGAAFALFSPKIRQKSLSLILGFSAGLMCAVVCFDLLPNALELSHPAVALGGVFIGGAAAFLVQDIIKYRVLAFGGNTMLGTGFVLFITISAHNFPEGLAVGSGLEASLTLGISLAVVIALHDIPEGIALALPLKSGGMKPYKAALMALASGLPMVLGALVGSLSGRVSKEFVALSLAIAGGTMLYVSIGDLIPQASRLYSGRSAYIAEFMGIICGFLISNLL